MRVESQTGFLRFRYPFRIAHGTRLGTDVVFVRLTSGGYVGFGEATLPPYLGTTMDDVLRAIHRPGIIEGLQLDSPFEWHAALCQIIPDVMPALAALDMARWQLETKLKGKSFAELMEGEAQIKSVPHTYTLGVSEMPEMLQKISFAEQQGFTLFKLKLDGVADADVIRNFRSTGNKPFAVDVNQAWRSLEQAMPIVELLEESNCILLEQPFHKLDRELSFQLASRTHIPIIADEACQRLNDLEEIVQAFDGVNVKLQKCGGVTPAYEQLKQIGAAQKKSLIGCMSESSIGCNAAEQLTYLCDWADLDGPYLNENNDLICSQMGYSL
jgi:L-alanine-DL-glutamate epimerase-like enolase superfamily enzyme